MNQNQELNNTCILFDPNNEAQQEAIIKFYNDNGWSMLSVCDKSQADKYIGVCLGSMGFWFNPIMKMKVIDLPKEYYPIDTPIVESEKDSITLETYLRNKVNDCEKYSDFSIATDTLRCWIDEYNTSRK